MRTVKLYSHQLFLNALSIFQDLTPRAVKKKYIFLKQLKCYDYCKDYIFRFINQP